MAVELQFFITLGEKIDYLDGKHAVFGLVVVQVEEGLDKLNEIFVDQDGWPFKDVRIKPVIILGKTSFTFCFPHFYLKNLGLNECIDYPFPDPPGLIKHPIITNASTRQLYTNRGGWRSSSHSSRRRRTVSTRKSSSSICSHSWDGWRSSIRQCSTPQKTCYLFVNLNPVTGDEDLELIFSQFGLIMSCQVIRDKRTGDSLQHAFIELNMINEKMPNRVIFIPLLFGEITHPMVS